MYFEEKIEAPLTPALAPGASIGKNTVNREKERTKEQGYPHISR